MKPSDSSPAVICRGLTKQYDQGAASVLALRGVDLEVRFGELTLLAGPSGCGKTTLLSVVAGILQPTDGEVVVLGTDLSRMAGWRKVAFRRRNIGFVFQQYNLLPALTAAENAAVPLVIARYPKHRALARALELLKAMGMSDRAGARPARLSGGEQQRVAIARALVHDPRLVVCDEPTSALDASTGHAIMDLLRSVAVHPDRAVLVVTHDPRVFEYGDRIAEMNDGRIVSVEQAHAALANAGPAK